MPRKRCRILANEAKGKKRPPCAVDQKLPCQSIKCRQSQGAHQLTALMIRQGISIGKEERAVIQDVATHYFCSTALGKKPRDFGFFKIKEIKNKGFEIKFKNVIYYISFT